MASDICASFVTSQIDEYATPSAARIASQTSEASLMSRISIFAPSAARRIAAARPSPAAAPDTTATRSFNRLMFLPFFPRLWVLFLFLSLKFSELSVNRVQSHQSLERMCARRDQHPG